MTLVASKLPLAQEPALHTYGPIIEWYRPKLMARVLKIWLIASGLIVLGSLLAGFAFLTREWISSNMRFGMGFLGGISTLVGALYGMSAMPRLLQEERYLALFRGGVLLREQDTFSFVPWDELMDAEWDTKTSALCLHLRESPPLYVGMSFIDIQQRDLAKRINQIRRKAQMGLKI